MPRNAHAKRQWPITAQLTIVLLLAGVAQALSLAWPFDGAFKGDAQGWLQWASLAVLAHNIDRSTSGLQAFVKT